jgi:hypothetical protein
MALVPGGSFILGKSDSDLANVEDAQQNGYCSFFHMKQKQQ